MFATPRQVSSIDDCAFYHVMDIPGHGTTTGQWDLRGKVDEYLGFYDFAGKRVLEIGPASGFLTFEMERRGADIVAVEVPDDPGWDFVPQPASVLAAKLEPRRRLMTMLKSSFWFAHAAHASKAKVYYGDVYALPEQLGRFDVAVMAAVLLHCRHPLSIIEQCARRANALIITDEFHADLEGRPICRLKPSLANGIWESWWAFSTDIVSEFARILEFNRLQRSIGSYRFEGHGDVPFFTLVATRGETPDDRWTTPIPQIPRRRRGLLKRLAKRWLP